VIPNRPAARTALRALFASLLLAVVLGTPLPAQADDALARQYFRQGVDLYDKKQYQPALESFQKAYAEKASPGIKQNIALCLKGLGRPIEAAIAFDEALDEGQGTLKPEVRAAMEQELGELSKIVGTVRLKVISSADQKPVDEVVVTVDGKPLSPAAMRRPVRLEPGIHVFTAHADRLADPPDKKLSILAGSPVDATFELGAPVGTLTIMPSVPDATVHVDGAAVARGTWPLRLPAGKHRVSVAAPGYQTMNAEIVVSPGAVVEYPIKLLHPGDVPPAYEGPVRKPPPAPKSRYLVPTLAYEGQSFRLAPILGERVGGSKRTFTGAAVGARGGYRLWKNFALEVQGEIGQVGATYRIADSSLLESSTRVVHWQFTSGLRFTTGGSFRFTTGLGFGVHGLSVSAQVFPADRLSNSVNMSGSGLSASGLGDMGMQLDVGAIFLEAVGFVDVHGVGAVREDATNQRMFLSSPSTRAGVRIGLGIPF
jgi:hypothetical protein